MNRKQTYAGNILNYQLKVKNLTHNPQEFEVTDVLPAGVTYLRGGSHDPATRTVTWKGALLPHSEAVLQIQVRLNRDVAAGTVIVNHATLKDDGPGGSVSAITIVKAPPPPKGRRADVDVTGMAGDDN